MAADPSELVANAHQRHALRQRLALLEDQVDARRRRVVDALFHFQTRLPDSSTPPTTALGPDECSAIADGFLALCQILRDQQFDIGLERLTGSTPAQAADTLAVQLFRLAAAADAPALVELLQAVAGLPETTDAFPGDPVSPRKVWAAVHRQLERFLPVPGTAAPCPTGCPTWWRPATCKQRSTTWPSLIEKGFELTSLTSRERYLV